MNTLSLAGSTALWAAHHYEQSPHKHTHKILQVAFACLRLLPGYEATAYVAAASGQLLIQCENLFHNRNHPTRFYQAAASVAFLGLTILGFIKQSSLIFGMNITAQIIVIFLSKATTRAFLATLKQPKFSGYFVCQILVLRSIELKSAQLFTIAAVISACLHMQELANQNA